MSDIRSCEVRVVHLARAVGRRALMEAEFARVGVTPTAWAGVDGRAPENAARLAALPASGPWGPMDGHAKGCLLSHLDAFAAFLKGNASHLLMFEDDVFIGNDMAAWLTGSWWPADADLVKIERWRDDKLRLVVDHKASRHAGRTLRRLHSRHSGTGGYFITRAGAELVLASSVRSVPVDHLLFNPYVSPIARDLVTYQVFPALVVQGNEPAPPAASAPTSPPLAAPPRRRKPLSQKLQRLGAEIRVLRTLPRLLSRRAFLTLISWQASVSSPADSQTPSKG